MKLKMKSAFAMIAIALMVMVAVVPMVSVFTSDSEAADPIIDPSTDGAIIFTGNVKNAAGSNVTSGYVIVTYEVDNKTYADYTEIGSNGSYTLTVSLPEITNVNVYVASDVSGAGEDITADSAFTSYNYASIKDTSTGAGTTVTCNFVAGMVSVSGQLKFKSGTSMSEYNFPNIGSLVITYTNGAATDSEKVTYAAATLAIDGAGYYTGAYSALVPKSVGAIAVEVSGLTGYFFTGSTGKTVGTANITDLHATANYNLMAITIAAGLGDLEIDLNATKTESDYSNYLTVENYVTTSLSSGDVAYFGIANNNTETWTTGSVTITIGNDVYGKDLTFSISKDAVATGSTSFSPIYKISGTFSTNSTYGSIPLVNGAVTLEFRKSTTLDTADADAVKTSVAVDSTGTYTYWYKTESVYTTDYTKVKAIFISGSGDSEFKADSGNSTNISATAATTAGNAAVNVATGYKVVTGDVKTESNTGITGVSLTITAENSSGSPVFIGGADSSGNVVTSGGTYRFFVKDGSKITVTPVDENGAVFSVGKITANVDDLTKSGNYYPIGTTVIIYNKTLTSTLKVVDAAEKTITSGVEVTSVLMSTGEAIGTPSISKGVISIVVPSNTDVTDVGVFLTSTTYTFDACAAAYAVSYSTSEQSDLQAYEATYGFTVVDSNGEAVALTGTSSPSAAQVGVAANAYWAKYINATSVKYTDVAAIDVTVDGNSVSFIAPAYMVDPELSGILYLPVITINVLNGSDKTYIWDDIYTFTENGMIITAGTEDFDGKLFRSNGTTPISGAAVSFYPYTGADAITAKTGSDGSFEVVSTAAIDKTQAYLVFELNGYGFVASYKAYDSTNNYAKVDEFKASEDKYVFTVTDNDEEPVSVSGTSYYVKYVVKTSPSTTYAVSKSGVLTLALKAGDEMTFYISNTNSTTSLDQVRASITYTATAEDLADGKIALKTTEQLYTLLMFNADGTSYTAGDDYTVYAYDSENNRTEATIYEGAAVTGSEGAYTGYMTAPDKSSTVAYYKVVGEADTYMAGASAKFDAESNVALLIAILADIDFQVATADGTALTLAAAVDGVTAYTASDSGYVLYKAGLTVNTNGTITLEKAKVSDSYAFIFNNAINNARLTATGGNDLALTFGNSLNRYVDADDDGLVCANESLIKVTAKDATGSKKLTIDTLTVSPSTVTATVVAPYVFADEDAIESYKATFTDAGYSAAESDSPAIVAAESYVLFETGYYVYDADDMTVQVTLTYGLTTGAVASNSTIILGAAIADTSTAYFVADMSGVTSTYVVVMDDGVVVAYGTLEGSAISTVVTDIQPVTNATPLQFQDYITLDDTAVIGDVITLYATDIFYVMDASEIVSIKYTFDGWYVNGELLSEEPVAVYAVTGTSNIAALYTAELIQKVVYEDREVEKVVVVEKEVPYEVEKEKIVTVTEEKIVEVEKPVVVEKEVVKTVKEFDTSAIIVGVCAVVIALIAVAYAIIHVRRNN